METRQIRTAVPWLGVAAVALTFAAIGLAIALSPAFALTENALSNLGDAGDLAGTGTTELVFNGGLILGGILGVGFGLGLALLADGLLERIGAAVFAVAMASMAGVGLIPQDQSYHFQVASGLYVLFSVGVLCYGAGEVRGGDRQCGLFSISVGVANLAVWTGWILTGGLARPGLAIPELLGALLIAVWTIPTALRIRAAPPARSSPFEWG